LIWGGFLNKRLEIICYFCNTIPTIINGIISKIGKTNLNYIEPHKIIIKLLFKF